MYTWEGEANTSLAPPPPHAATACRALPKCQKGESIKHGGKQAGNNIATVIIVEDTQRLTDTQHSHIDHCLN